MPRKEGRMNFKEGMKKGKYIEKRRKPGRKEGRMDGQTKRMQKEKIRSE